MDELTPVQARENEVAQYTANIAMYQAIIDALPKDWPANLEQYKGRTDHQEVAAQIEDLNDVALVSQLLYREQCEKAIRTEMMERTKAQSILTVLEAQQAM